MTKETKIGLLVGLAFIILFGIILSEKGTSRNDHLNTPPIAAFKPVVELIPPTTPPAAPLTKNNSGKDVAERLTMSEPEVKVTDSTAPPGSLINNHILKPVETTTPVQEPPLSNQDLAPNLKRLLPPNQSKSLTQIPAANPTGSDIQAVANALKFTPIEVDAPPAAGKTADAREVKTHTIQAGETLAAICRQYYPQQPYEMLKRVQEYNRITRPEKLMIGQVIKLPPEHIDADSSAKSAARDEKSALASSDLLTPADDATLEALFTPRSDGKAPPASAKTASASARTEPARTPNSKPAARTYVVQNHDTLVKIARRFYGTDKAWIKIYEWNKKIIANPRSLKSGLKLQIPPAPVRGTDELAAGPKVD